MLDFDAEDLAERFRRAMDDHEPPIAGSEIAIACKVTPQAVSGWRKDGRIAKKHLQQIAAITEKPVEYFLGAGAEQDKKHNGHGKGKKMSPWDSESIYDEREFAILFRAWQDTDKNGRGALLGVANAVRKAHAVRRKQSS